MSDQTTVHMEQALIYARQAAERGEVPIGAVIVDAQGLVLAGGYNTVESERTQRAHAEMAVLHEAARLRKDWRLDGCTLYVTLEPCLMCYACAALSRVHRIVYAAPSPRFGAFSLGLEEYLQTKQNVYTDDVHVACASSYTHAAQELLRDFFARQRMS